MSASPPLPGRCSLGDRRRDKPLKYPHMFSRAFTRLLRAGHPFTVMAVGALFALSFDTFSQAPLFAVTAAQFGGWSPALALALVFTSGMLADGANGYWISRLVRRSDETARVASRVMALAVGGVSLLTAGLALATLLLPAMHTWTEGRELWFGTGICAVLLASYLIGQRLALRRRE